MGTAIAHSLYFAHFRFQRCLHSFLNVVRASTEYLHGLPESTDVRKPKTPEAISKPKGLLARAVRCSACAEDVWGGCFRCIGGCSSIRLCYRCCDDERQRRLLLCEYARTMKPLNAQALLPLGTLRVALAARALVELVDWARKVTNGAHSKRAKQPWDRLHDLQHAA